jgi:hypothetical protein
MTNYYLLEFKDSSSYECWFDDDYTIGKKVDLALARKFRGVGIWALGYDDPNGKVTRTIVDKFTNDMVMIQDPVTAVKGFPIRVAAFLDKYRSFFIIAAILMAMTVAFAFFIAFTDWRVRDSIFNQENYYYVFLLTATLLLIPLLSVLQFFVLGRWALLLAFIVGIIAGYFILQLTFVFSNRKP